LEEASDQVSEILVADSVEAVKLPGMIGWANTKMGILSVSPIARTRFFIKCEKAGEKWVCVKI
jgi:hypothetical protein